MELRCPRCGEPNRVDESAPVPAGTARACRSCGAPLPASGPGPSASIARQRLLDDSPLARLPLKPAAPTWPPQGMCPLPTGPARPLPTAPPAVTPRPRAEPFPVRRVPPAPRGTRRPRSLFASLLWFLGALGLLAVAGAQAVWQRPEMLDRSAALRQAAELACAELGCVLPEASDPAALRIQASALAPLEGVPRVHSLRVAVVNRAARPQVPTGLRLTLVDEEDRIVARRVFRPDEYLRGDTGPIPPGARLEVDLTVEAPETEFAGYRVDLAAQ